jgi:two-component system alkaline phosphatase synthesis response regulator PhoP
MSAGPIPRKRVLIAEDDLGQRRLLQFCLEQLGHHVVTASDGQKALDLAMASDFDAIILDVQMPQLTGLEVLRRLRQEQRAENAYIVVLTSETSEDMVAAAYGDGANMYLTKPVSPALLARIFKGSSVGFG